MNKKEKEKSPFRFENLANWILANYSQTCLKGQVYKQITVYKGQSHFPH
jgi:hypothetical protein